MQPVLRFAQVRSSCLSSVMMVPRQVALGLPGLRLPGGVHCMETLGIPCLPMRVHVIAIS